MCHNAEPVDEAHSRLDRESDNLIARERSTLVQEGALS